MKRFGESMYSAMDTIEKYNMLSVGDKVVVGVSGGPDSIALLYFLHQIKDRYSLSLHVAHLNHMLRGDEADKDTEYVVKFCEGLNVPCTVKYVDIKEMAKQNGLSSEEAGRKARYEFFSDVLKETNGHKVALAHNLNDQAETIIMRIMRGTGLDGLCGIKPFRDHIYIRPLLYTSRCEIEEYCSKNNLLPRIDKTNLETIYTRNKIRLELIPYIKENFNTNIESTISSMTDILSEDNDFIEGYADEIYNKISIKKENKVLIDIDDINRLHDSIKKRVIRKAINDVKGDLISIESKHIDIIMSIIDRAETGIAIDLPKNLKAKVEYGKLIIIRQQEHNKYRLFRDVYIPSRVYIDEINCIFNFSILDLKDNKNIDYKNKNKAKVRFIKYFDYDKIKGNLSIRYRKDGDYIIPLGMRGRKKLKDYFIDKKVPRDRRDEIPLIALGQEILWIVGFTINDNYKIDNYTNKILKIELTDNRRGDTIC